MRVLLIPPTYRYRDEYPALLSASDFPAGFGYLAAVLKQAGHEVYGCNPNNIVGYVDAKTMLTDTLTKKIVEVKPDLVGLGGLCTDYAFLRDAIEIVRKTTKAPIVLGGQIVTNDAEFIYQDLMPDYAVKGEGEGAILKIAAGECQPGIINVQYVQELDTLPFPDYEPFGMKEMVDQYSMATRLLYRYSRPDARPFNIVASRSCPFSCTFCVHGRRDIPYRARSIKNVMEEIKDSYEKYKFNVLIILDELFAVKNDRLKDFSKAVLEGKEKYGWDFDWMFQTHASAHFNLDDLKLAKKAGCFFFSYGLESACPVVLESMNKRIKIEQVIEAQELCRKVGIGFGGNLIFGDPSENEETISESLSFWLTHCKDNFVFLSTLMPYPGSKIFNDIYKDMTFDEKHKFYEAIDKGYPNMTKMKESAVAEFHKLLTFMEQSWLFCKATPVTKIEPYKGYDLFLRTAGGFYYYLYAKCPYCGEEIKYRERFVDPRHQFWLGTGCTKCNRKIKIEYMIK